MKSIRYRPGWHKSLYAIFVVNFFVLGYLGVQPPTFWGTLIAQVGTVSLLIFHFDAILSSIGRFGNVPARVNFQPH